MAAILTVRDAMIACGIHNVALFIDKTQAQRIAEDIFGDLFTSCMDVTFKELDKHFKTYSDLTVPQGQIRLRPGTRKNAKAFVQWTRDKICLGRDPSHNPFPVHLVSNLFVITKLMKSFKLIRRPYLRLRSPTNSKIT